MKTTYKYFNNTACLAIKCEGWPNCC